MCIRLPQRISPRPAAVACSAMCVCVCLYVCVCVYSKQRYICGCTYRIVLLAGAVVYTSKTPLLYTSKTPLFFATHIAMRLRPQTLVAEGLISYWYIAFCC